MVVVVLHESRGEEPVKDKEEENRIGLEENRIGLEKAFRPDMTLLRGKREGKQNHLRRVSDKYRPDKDYPTLGWIGSSGAMTDPQTRQKWSKCGI